jgi:hypothetical protein
MQIASSYRIYGKVYAPQYFPSSPNLKAVVHTIPGGLA